MASSDVFPSAEVAMADVIWTPRYGATGLSLRHPARSPGVSSLRPAAWMT